MSSISHDAKRNREDWTLANAESTDPHAAERWAAEEITWGGADQPDSTSTWQCEEICVAKKPG